MTDVANAASVDVLRGMAVDDRKMLAHIRPRLRKRSIERVNPEHRIDDRAEVRDTEPHDDYANIVRNAPEKICDHP